MNCVKAVTIKASTFTYTKSYSPGQNKVQLTTNGWQDFFTNFDNTNCPVVVSTCDFVSHPTINPICGDGS